MFTGIIESIGIVTALSRKGENLSLEISTSLSAELKPGDSVAHNGVCLTVETNTEESYTVTIIEESLRRSNLGKISQGDKLNLERAMPANARLDGHFVQGHVDCVATCISVQDKNGSTVFVFNYDKRSSGLLVEKGSISINGVSLTISSIDESSFSVSIIPFTLNHTNFGTLQEGEQVNIEFDILGKYVAKQIAAMQLKMFAEN